MSDRDRNYTSQDSKEVRKAFFDHQKNDVRLPKRRLIVTAKELKALKSAGARTENYVELKDLYKQKRKDDAAKAKIFSPPLKPTDDYLHEYLSDKLELIPLNNCPNPMTYRAETQPIFDDFKSWLQTRRKKELSKKEFHETMLRLFPEPHAKYHPSHKDWWGFRYHRNGYLGDTP